MEVLGLIPARGGSRGIPRKNLAELAGRPLLAWTCTAALESTMLTRCVVSTDDPEIAEAARAEGVEVPFMRPAALAGDETPMHAVVLHALEAVGADVVVLLQPTSPLRTARHVDEAVRLLLDGDADSVVSVVRVPHNFVPSSLLAERDGRLVPVAEAGATRRQDKEVVFARNGPAVLATRAPVIRDGSLYGDACAGYEMDVADSVDVDTAFELELAGWLLDRREAH